ncbi:PASTA domain-containing protein [Desulfoluna spongiiphila]|uniref:Serine/threonine protein kinase n=1 Tax=Desulfoluna spongiiphila TaxID=419481 RepID=A0A1G5HR32_9BACT|nr:PASTA domain-containing protein [Desulfoluna spongiiphila]SCY66256.1 serine/threonine protein kinase [Desulfoluna spongiiphila]
MFKGLLKFVTLFILFVTAAGAASFVTLTYIIGNEKSVVVPDLVGRDVIYVLETLSTMELNTKVKGSEFSPRIPRNRVIFQDPEPGTRMKRGRDVRIVFSKGPQLVAMPSLKHLALAEAKIQLTEMGLEFGVTSALFHPGVEKGAVIAHVPSPGALVTRGDKVDLLLSNGKKPKAIMMADLTTNPLDMALERIESMGLKVGTITSTPSKKAERNSVLDQSPKPGFKVTQGQIVDITINRAPRPDSEATGTGATGSRLFTWRIDEGFLKKRVKIQLVGDRHTDTILDREALPGEELWVLVPTFERTTLFLYENGHLKETRFFD